MALGMALVGGGARWAMLPVDYAPAADPHDGPAEPVLESWWLEPYPDETLGLEGGGSACPTRSQPDP